jgi:eukaryotic-like serine/threonine-protein kinase
MENLVESLEVDQRTRWRRGEHVCVETYLEQYPRLRADPESTIHLVYNEVLLRESAGEGPRLDDFLRRFPEVKDRLIPLFEVHSALESEQLLHIVGEATGPSPWPHLVGYEILAELGRGGMGVVYKARQVGLNRLVALKMILAGQHAAPAQMARFLTEAEAVARLQHPNIVQIHDFGEQEGRPYFSMEFVDGPSLAQALAAGTALSARRSAILIQTLARAIHTAHQKGIIHRDLKPANVLMQDAGSSPPFDGQMDDRSSVFHLDSAIPKITDFGLAKQIDSAQSTVSGMIIGTPSYMAPEQAGTRDGAVGPPADVYALGAILYELLAGRPPFKSETPLDTLRQVVADEPVPLSRFDPRIPRDLGTICWKCLQKEPLKRYRSALSLAEDLDRYLNGQPIHARPASVWERAWKWAKRRPMVAASLAISGIALLCLMIMWISFTVNLEHERIRADGEALAAWEQRRRAETSRDRALTAIDKFLTRVGQDQLANVPGMDLVRRGLLQDALEMQQGLLLDQDERDPALRRQVALALQRVARIHWTLRERDREEQAYRQARGIQQQLVNDFPNEPAYARDLGLSLHHLAVLARVNRSAPEAEEAFRQALAVRQDLEARFPEDPDYRADLAQTLMSSANIYRRADLRRTREIYLQVLKIQEALLKDSPDSIKFLSDVANTSNSLGAVAFDMNDLDEALTRFQRNREFFEHLVKVAPNDVTWKGSVAGAWGNMAAVYKQKRRFADALEAYDKAIAIRSRLVDDHPAVPTQARQLGANQVDRGMTLLDLDRWSEANASFLAARTIFQLQFERFPKEAINGRNLAAAHIGIAQVDRQLDRWEQARSHTQTAIAVLETQLRAEPKSFELLDTLATALTDHGIVLEVLQQPGEAKAALARAVDLGEDIRRREPKFGRLGEILRAAYETRGDLLMRESSWALAGQDWERAIAVLSDNPVLANQASRINAALLRLLAKDYQGARSLMDSLNTEFANRIKPELTFRIAWIYMLAANAVNRDSALPSDEKARLAESCQAQAMEALRRGQRGQFFRWNLRRRMLLSDPILAPLRQRPDFQATFSVMGSEESNDRAVPSISK